MGIETLQLHPLWHGRIDCIVHEWESTCQIQDAKPRGRPRTVTLPIQEFIDVRTVQDTHLSCQALSVQIAERFHIPVSIRNVSRYRRLMRFHYRPARHTQQLTMMLWNWGDNKRLDWPKVRPANSGYFNCLSNYLTELSASLHKSLRKPARIMSTSLFEQISELLPQRVGQSWKAINVFCLTVAMIDSVTRPSEAIFQMTD
jgi:hypothetical protein